MRTLVFVAVAASLVAGAACERADAPTRAASGGSAIVVPPPLPGEPAIGADREAMLQKFAANISQGLYTRDNLLFLLCNTEAGKAIADASGDPLTRAMLRRMVALFRAAPGMATARCAPAGAAQPGSPYPDR